MQKNTAQSSKVQVGNWNVELVSDEDGHLYVDIDNADGSQVNMIEEDIADNGTQWADRFTTKKLEQEYRDSE